MIAIRCQKSIKHSITLSFTRADGGLYYSVIKKAIFFILFFLFNFTAGFVIHRKDLKFCLMKIKNAFLF
jgi:hypothetical protein